MLININWCVSISVNNNIINMFIGRLSGLPTLGLWLVIFDNPDPHFFYKTVLVFL